MKKKIVVTVLACFALLAMTTAQTQTTPGAVTVTVPDTVAVVTTQDVREILLFIKSKVSKDITVAEWEGIESAVGQLVAARREQYVKGRVASAKPRNDGNK